MQVSFKLDDLKIAPQCHRFKMSQQYDNVAMFVVGVAGTSCQLPQSSATIANLSCQLPLSASQGKPLSTESSQPG